MILLPHYKSKKVGVVGLGKSGMATIAALEASGAQVLAWDDGLAKKGDSPVMLTPLEAWPWEQIADLILSPGVPLTHPQPHAAVILAQQHGVRIIGDVELLLTACPHATVIGITGTNGKSTTTALIGHILQSSAGRRIQVGGNLGTPVLSFEPLAAGDIYVLELSSYQLELLDEARIHVGCLLNITPDHLDRHGSMEGYVQAKQRMFVHQHVGDTAIIGVDDAYTEAVAHELIAAGQRMVIPVGVKARVAQGIEVRAGVLRDGSAVTPLQPPGGDLTPSPSRGEGWGGGALEITSDGDTLDLTPCLALKGAHNWQNAAVAFAACRAVGILPDVIADGLRSFPGLAHRMERVMSIQHVTFVNDSKATNADAAAKALGSYDSIYWIAGGLPKEGGISTLGQFFPRIRHAFLIGQAAEAFAKTLDGHVPYTLCGTLEVATQHAARMALAHATPSAVLLSPACASWDQWPNFEARGEAFRQYAQALEKERAA
ncbi:MAG: UDP-N-acetylmuramoyl-L-alanine--D-glutamate ligase [Rickettsiales bacterium]|nr:UDP-N-acetylmuramoyl-L-alanine--D-glutamate ligase [Rickettsiales bacterium]